MSTRVRLVILGAVLVLAGLGAGFWPLSSAAAKCGSAFHAASYVGDARIELDRAAAQAGVMPPPVDCDGERADVRWIAVGLLVVGGAMLAAGWVVAGNRRSPAHGGRSASEVH